MTAPTRTRPAPTRRAPRNAPPTRRGGRSVAAQRAYERKVDRTQRWNHLVPEQLASVAVARKVPFVVLVIALLGLGLVSTLWLSTNSAASSYQITDAQKENRLLSERVEALQRDVATMDSAAALATRAKQLGMVPSTNVARLSVGPDGAVTVVGSPAPAAPPAGPPPAPQVAGVPPVGAAPSPVATQQIAPATRAGAETPTAGATTPTTPSATTPRATRPTSSAPAGTSAPAADSRPAAPATQAPAPAAPTRVATIPPTPVPPVAEAATTPGAPPAAPAVPQAHSEQIQPGAAPATAGGGA
ncbi:hypothetical protein [Rhodococcus sp. X156]|uniref:hypothetical protein n=1 Tax=Rhodococcus sp. X156 TaxID=2499145 RepID=UPI000FDC5B33|nr:hypothetical protein [Rhodococcus sp. X156]